MACPPLVPLLHNSWPANGSARRKGGPLGLRNLGNTCYLNSVLQCLTYTPPLADLCLHGLHSSCCNALNGKNNSNCPFCFLEKRIQRSLTTDSEVDAPVKIYNRLQYFAKHFRNGRQEDAHELLRYAIEACNSVCVQLHKLLLGNKSAIKHTDAKGSKEEPHTVVKEIFGGILQSQVKCLSCTTESNKLDEIMDLSLDIVRLHSVKEALCRFFQPEVLDGDNKYRCNQCKKLSPARKQMAVYRAPNVLVIQLKRFENIFGGKIDRHVLFEERLGLEGHMCRASKNARPEYVLYGVVVHAGHSQDAGHYYAYVKDASGRWFCCNDASVSPVNTQSVLAEKAYMLFYVRTSAGPKICKETVAPCGAWTPSPPVTPDTGPSESQKKSGLSTAHPGPLFGNSTNTSGNGRGTTSPQMKLGGTVAFNGGKSGLVGNGSHYKLEPLVNGKSVTKDHTCRQSDSMSNGLAVDDQSASFNSDSIKGDEILPIYGPNLPLLPLSTPAEGLRSAYQAVTVVSTTQSVIPEDPSQVCKQTESTLNHSLGDGPLPATENANGGTVTSSHAKAITLSASALLSQGASSLGSGHVLSKEEMQTPELLGNNKEIECRVEAEVVHQKTLLEGERVFCRKRLQKEVCSSFSTNGHEEKREGVAPNVDTDERHGSMDVEQLSELEKLKILLEKEGREELQRSGWCDAVRESMQAAKKRRLLPRDLTEKAHLRKQLIVEVQGSLKLQVPRELKEHLVEQLRAFFAPKDC